VHHAEHTLATDRYNFDQGTAYQAVAYSVRDYLVESLRDTKAHYVKEDPKRVYYLSLEFLMGRSLLNSLMNLDLQAPYKEALQEIGYKLEDLVEEEKDAALGNGVHFFGCKIRVLMCVLQLLLSLVYFRLF